ncbi:MAG: hypothetical protein QM727_15415 [Niabella sp.]
MTTKNPKESVVIMTELVLPNDTNHFGNLMGGRLMYWMDIAGALSAQKHSNRPVVTASVEQSVLCSIRKTGACGKHYRLRNTRLQQFDGSAY